MVHGHDNRAGTKEQEGLEKGMRHDMKDAPHESSHTECGEHITQLADCGICQDLLDIRLGEAYRGRENSSQCPDDCDNH